MLLRFSFKESVFKALHPVLKRPIAFHEVSVFPDHLSAAGSTSSPSSSPSSESMSVVKTGSAILHFHLSQGEMFDYAAQVPLTTCLSDFLS